jgi:hypothetical protein
MTKKILLGLALVFALSCNKDDDKDSIKQGKGKVWLWYSPKIGQGVKI